MVYRKCKNILTLIKILCVNVPTLKYLNAFIEYTLTFIHNMYIIRENYILKI